MSRITKVVPDHVYSLIISLDNGSKLIWNMECQLQTVRFKRLMNEEFFRTVTTDGVCIRWGNVIEVSISEMFLFLQK